jgi:hypothetical protein
VLFINGFHCRPHRRIEHIHRSFQHQKAHFSLRLPKRRLQRRTSVSVHEPNHNGDKVSLLHTFGASLIAYSTRRRDLASRSSGDSSSDDEDDVDSITRHCWCHSSISAVLLTILLAIHHTFQLFRIQKAAINAAPTLAEVAVRHSKFRGGSLHSR